MNGNEKEKKMKKNIWMKRGKRVFAAAMGMTMICTMVGMLPITLTFPI